jgi:hypothetical protein
MSLVDQATSRHRCDRCDAIIWTEHVRVAGYLMDWKELCEECYASYIRCEFFRIKEDI